MSKYYNTIIIVVNTTIIVLNTIIMIVNPAYPLIFLSYCDRSELHAGIPLHVVH